MLNPSHKKTLRQMLSVTAAAMLLWQSSAAVVVNAKTTGADCSAVTAGIPASTYKHWKQYSPAWANLPVGKFGGNMQSIGCAVTAAAILCAASHSAVPEGFDPGVLCDYLTKNGGFSINGDLQWQVISKLVPDFRYESTRTFSSKNQRDQIAELNAYLAEGYFVAVKLTRTVNGVRTSHFVAIDRIENGVVYMCDPGSSYDVLYDRYDSYMLESVRLFRGGDSPIVTAPESPAQQPEGAYLTTDRLNLRSGAGTDHEVLTVLPKDTYIEITEVAADWGKTVYNGREGWVCMRYCTPAVSIFTIGDYCTDGNTLPLRSAPAASATAVGYLPPNTMISVTAVNGDWGYCTYNDKSGWVSLRYCTCNEGSADIGVSLRYTTAGNQMRLRTGASTATATLAMLPPDTEFTVTQIEGNWGKTVYNGQIGWIYIPYCTLIADDTPATPTAPDTPDIPEETVGDLYTTGNYSLRLRAEASDNSDTLAYIGANTELIITQIADSWGKTTYNGKDGWVYLGYCTLVTENIPAEPDTPIEPDTPAVPEETLRDLYTTGNNSLRLRAEASDNSDTLAYIGTNTELIITQIADGWGKTVYNGKDGWVYLGYCTLVTENIPAEPDTPTEPDTPAVPEETLCDLYTTGHNSLRLRAEASDTSDTLAYIGTNTELIITQIADGWGKTAYNGKEGWVYLGLCTLLEHRLPDEGATDSPWCADLGNCVVVADGLYVYTANNGEGATLAPIRLGTPVTVVEIAGDWAKIHWNDGMCWIRLGEYGTPYVYLAGDVTLDGAVNISDHKLMEAFFSGVALPDALQMLVADVNGDGSVNDADRAILAAKGE